MADIVHADNQAEATEELPHMDEAILENTAVTENTEPPRDYREQVTTIDRLPYTNAPKPTSSMGFTTELYARTFGIRLLHHSVRQETTTRQKKKIKI